MKTRFIFAVIIVLTLALADSFSQIKIVSGKVGIGQDPPAEKLHINGYVRGNQSGALRINTGNGYTDLGPKNTSFAHFYSDRPRYYFNKEIIVNSGYFSSYNNQPLYLRPNRTTKVTILTNGNMGIGMTPDAAIKLDVNGYVRAYNIEFESDIRFKKDIADLEPDALVKLINLKAKTYKSVFRPDTYDAIVDTNDSLVVEPEISVESERTMIGFVAQDVKDIFPELVNEDEDGYLSLNYVGLIPIMVEAIKEQQELIKELSDKVAELQGLEKKRK